MAHRSAGDVSALSLHSWRDGRGIQHLCPGSDDLDIREETENDHVFDENTCHRQVHRSEGFRYLGSLQSSASVINFRHVNRRRGVSGLLIHWHTHAGSQMNSPTIFVDETGD